ncbi:similar to bacteriocin transporter subunit, putative fragment [Alteracholeplasma palmae J233]|uniref:Similar to bacteriocin transporter subunit, putative n=1 Tax=Alteracholeplasma palmae (strain ATCC 49389 / J233) TaxID=1318466 RepID=U4KNA4_ALTPJ|nr:cysteine peptidase family C39 domain-containing protein [Alteracholeplasma palmae]CCV63655.1 similar to bacteriocin transporter subunit, putative fragment [Alteracholeplasma palmae J233]
MKRIHVRQHDQTDCAAASLATVSIFYGREITISKLRDICGTDIKGTSVAGLVEGAKQLGFDAKSVRISEEIV